MIATEAISGINESTFDGIYVASSYILLSANDSNEAYFVIRQKSSNF